MPRTVPLAEVAALVGEDLGHSGWLTVDQRRIDAFADATGDHQWIHVDTIAAQDGPYGGTIAHGHLTLSLIIPLWSELLEIQHVTTKINYGLDRVRFPAPVRSGSRVRLQASIAEVIGIPGGVQLVVDATMRAEGESRPVCVARPVLRYLA
ncbi:MaoC family dehydratase [Actinomadura sp. NPDC049753]|uniref:MaoC family dehydratase n=1 Tax=Actinomadura sp. NPDC049753 TaxID=3154739 RepID=UPI0034409238